MNYSKNKAAIHRTLFAIALVVAAPSVKSETLIDKSQPWIEVTGTASRQVDYDGARIYLSISKDGDDAKELGEFITKTLTDFDKTVQSFGVAAKQIKITTPTISKAYENENDAKGAFIKKKYIGFIVACRINIEVNDFNLINKIISAGVDAGMTVSDTSFFVSKEDLFRQELGKEAVKSATTQAREMIISAGLTPGRILEIGDPDRSVGESDLPSKKRSAAGEDAPEILTINVPIRPGMETISRSVQVKMEILSKH